MIDESAAGGFAHFGAAGYRSCGVHRSYGSIVGFLVGLLTRLATVFDLSQLERSQSDASHQVVEGSEARVLR